MNTTSSSRRCDVAIFGFGAVGRAIATLLAQRRGRYADVYRADVRLVAIRRARVEMVDPDGLDVAAWDEESISWRAVDGPYEAPVADVLIDAGPTDLRAGGSALKAVSAMLEEGRHVVAVSKGAVVARGPELRAKAASSKGMLGVSAAAGAALPALDLLRYGVLGCEIVRVEGVLNATSNYLLSAMMERDLTLDGALVEARRAGFVEANPRSDIEGWDTAAKLVILANFGLDVPLRIETVDVVGLQDVTPGNIQDWKTRGLKPKLVGSLRREDGRLEARVELRALPASDALARVDGSDKAVRIVTDAMGEIFASGCGPEPLATAAAALKDLERILEAMR